MQNVKHSHVRMVAWREGQQSCKTNTVCLEFSEFMHAGSEVAPAALINVI
jgi:hypothetical protein